MRSMNTMRKSGGKKGRADSYDHYKLDSLSSFMNSSCNIEYVVIILNGISNIYRNQ